MALLEVCVDSLPQLARAQAGGAGRIELCSRLDLDGLTPERELRAHARALARVPVHAMLRPRAGAACYSAAEHALMLEDLEALRSEGFAGVVLASLQADGALHLARLRELASAAAPLALTFHRAFDALADKPRALEQLIALGFARVLTSGGPPTAWEGRAVLAQLVAQAAGRIGILPGGRVRAEHAAELLALTGARELHSSAVFALA